MSQTEPIKIRATQRGVTIVCDAHVPLHEVISSLRARLLAAAQFYTDAAVSLELGAREITPADIKRLRSVLEDEFHLKLSGVGCSQEALIRFAARELGCPVEVQGTATTPEPSSAAVPEVAGDRTPDRETLIIRQTCRSGSTVTSPGNVVILGNVNPGAEVIARHDIIVAGALRGNAHAGAGGDASAVIVALTLEPKQLRIADQLGLPPAGERSRDRSRTGFVPEIAYIEDNRIVIEPYTGRIPGT